MADQLFFIQQGQVELINAEGQVFTTLKAGESFGEQAFLSGGIRGACAQSLGEVVCLKISSEQANKMMAGASPLLVPVFEALLLQLNMNNVLRAGSI
jgi:CRP-like cAMP-binding protein